VATDELGEPLGGERPAALSEEQPPLVGRRHVATRYTLLRVPRSNVTAIDSSPSVRVSVVTLPVGSTCSVSRPFGSYTTRVVSCVGVMNSSSRPRESVTNECVSLAGFVTDAR
jgi:hypothetical protein